MRASFRLKEGAKYFMTIKIDKIGIVKVSRKVLMKYQSPEGLVKNFQAPAKIGRAHV